MVGTVPASGSPAEWCSTLIGIIAWVSALWRPPHVDARILAQRSCFVVPNLKRKTNANDTGYGAAEESYLPNQPIALEITELAGDSGVTFEDICENYASAGGHSREVHSYVNVGMLVIPQKHKTELRAYLGALGLSSKTLFPDIDGYGLSFQPG